MSNQTLTRKREYTNKDLTVRCFREDVASFTLELITGGSDTGYAIEYPIKDHTHYNEYEQKEVTYETKYNFSIVSLTESDPEEHDDERYQINFAVGKEGRIEKVIRRLYIPKHAFTLEVNYLESSGGE